MVGVVLAQPSSGALTRISALATHLSVGLLGVAAEPPLTSALGADAWEELPPTKQVLSLFVLVVVAVPLYFAITLAAQLVASGLRSVPCGRATRRRAAIGSPATPRPSTPSATG